MEMLGNDEGEKWECQGMMREMEMLGNDEGEKWECQEMMREKF